MNKKSLILFFAAIGIIAMVYNIPVYNRWFLSKILTVSNIPDQMNRMTLEQRRETRYGYAYFLFKDIVAKIPKSEPITMLLPPDNYIQANKVADLRMVEPAVFYYFTGINAVTINSPKLHTANWAIVATPKGEISIVKLLSTRQIDSQAAIFRKYQP